MVAVSNRVVVRNGMGRFIADCEQAGHDTAEKLVKRGAKLSKQMAPTGSKHDPRTIPLKQSIESRMVSRTAGVWESYARHALHQEFGTGPHPIPGSPFLHFFWEAEGRWFVPGLMGPQDLVNHPGHGPQPFLRPAYEVIMAQAMSVARSEYPG